MKAPSDRDPTLTRMLRGSSASMVLNQGRIASIAATSHLLTLTAAVGG